MTTTPMAPRTTEIDPFLRCEDLAVEATHNPLKLSEYAEAYALVRELETPGRKHRTGMQTQVEKLINHMMQIGPISMREALLEYNVQSLTRRVTDITELGYVVVRVTKTNPVTGQEYSKYGLEGYTERPFTVIEFDDVNGQTTEGSLAFKSARAAEVFCGEQERVHPNLLCEAHDSAMVLKKGDV